MYNIHLPCMRVGFVGLADKFALFFLACFSLVAYLKTQSENENYMYSSVF